MRRYVRRRYPIPEESRVTFKEKVIITIEVLSLKASTREGEENGYLREGRGVVRWVAAPIEGGDNREM